MGRLPDPELPGGAEDRRPHGGAAGPAAAGGRRVAVRAERSRHRQRRLRRDWGAVPRASPDARARARRPEPAAPARPGFGSPGDRTTALAMVRARRGRRRLRDRGRRPAVAALDPPRPASRRRDLLRRHDRAGPPRRGRRRLQRVPCGGRRPGLRGRAADRDPLRDRVCEQHHAGRRRRTRRLVLSGVLACDDGRHQP